MRTHNHEHFIKTGKKYNVACLVSHPIQYYSPLFKQLAQNPKINLKVMYCSDESLKAMNDKEFGIDIKWDIPLLEGYRYKVLKNYSPYNTIFKLPFGLVNLGVIKEISKKRYDAVLIYSRQYITHLLAILTARLKGIPIFYVEESPLNQELLKPKWKIFAKKLLLGLIFSQINNFFAIGTENAKFYRFFGVSKKRILIMPYAVDNERYIGKYKGLIGDKSKIRKKLGIPKDKKVILFCGKLIAKKRPFDLLKAYESIHDDNKAIVFVGDGKLKPALEKYAKEKRLKDVYFTGFKNQTELPEYYTLSDIFVLPSTVGETWGLVVNEAMCFSLPVIISDIPGSGKDLVKHGENGFVFRTGHIEELTNNLSTLLQDKNLRWRMGQSSFKKIQKWSYNEDVEAVLAALTRLKR